MNNRDDFKIQTKDLLAKRVAYRCSNPNCKKLTIARQDNSEKCVIGGQAAHITAAAKGGPRYDKTLSTEERKAIDNGIWLCNNCAWMIDKDFEKYPVYLLKEWKEIAEQETKKLFENSNDDIIVKKENTEMELEFEEIYSKFEIKSNICSEISDILDSCKRTKSWNNQSYLHINEYTNGKFNIYEKFKTIEDIYDTTEIDFTDLIIVRDGLLEYLKKHIEMDKNIKNLHIYWTDQMRYNEIFEYIEIRPGITIEELNECTEFGIDIIINIVLDLYQKNKITTLNESDLLIQKETINKISLCKNYNKY